MDFELKLPHDSEATLFRAYADRLGNCDRIDYYSDDGWADMEDWLTEDEQQYTWEYYWELIRDDTYWELIRDDAL